MVSGFFRAVLSRHRSPKLAGPIFILASVYCARDGVAPTAMPAYRWCNLCSSLRRSCHRFRSIHRPRCCLGLKLLALAVAAIGYSYHHLIRCNGTGSGRRFRGRPQRSKVDQDAASHTHCGKFGFAARPMLKKQGQKILMRPAPQSASKARMVARFHQEIPMPPPTMPPTRFSWYRGFLR